VAVISKNKQDVKGGHVQKVLEKRGDSSRRIQKRNVQKERALSRRRFKKKNKSEKGKTLWGKKPNNDGGSGGTTE